MNAVPGGFLVRRARALSLRIRGWFRDQFSDERLLAFDQRLHGLFTWVLDRVPGPLGERLKNATGERFGIGSQVGVGLGLGVLLTLAASVVALGIMWIVNDLHKEISDVQVPGLVAAFEVRDLSRTLVAVSPRLSAAADADAVDEVTRDIVELGDELRYWIAELVRIDSESESHGEIADLAADLLVNLDALGLSTEVRMGHQALLQRRADELEQRLLQLNSELEVAKDDQFFYMATGWRELTDAARASSSLRMSPAEIDIYTDLLGVDASTNSMVTLMLQGATAPSSENLIANRERVGTERAEVERHLAGIEGPVADVLREAVDSLDGLYHLAQGIYPTRSLELEEIEAAEGLTRANVETADSLVSTVETLRTEARSSTEVATSNSALMLQIGFWTILAFNAVAVLAAVVLGWKFFGERLLNRIRHLSEAMAKMSGGELDVKVKIAGNDEVTDMAGALEIFRRHALEVQRLNLVEELAQEVQRKNEKLQSTLEHLEATQEQVVRQEKLASLGALTAGIAHEIRNPLNFVNNFAALSKEVIEEMREELGAEDGGAVSPTSENLEKVDWEYVDELMGDLVLNVGKVNEHGQRANRIVDGMLAHSRDAVADPEPVLVNQLLDEYAKLAYHGLRATNPDFNVTIERDFDEKAGTVHGIARDLSRVFLNIVTNACHATQDRREASPPGTYSPTILLSTMGEEDQVVVAIRDNGPGIPPDVLEKIFDPFFTTKKGTEGTGLGLSITHEIIQEHGGTLDVDTEVNEFTEFRVALPRQGSAVLEAGTA